MPPEPVITRWGTWVKAACYYANHGTDILPVLNLFERDDAIAIGRAIDSLQNPNIKGDLAFLKANYEFLPESIASLESASMQLVDAVGIVKDVVVKVGAVRGERGSSFRQKFAQVLDKNDGLKTLMAIAATLSGETGVNAEQLRGYNSKEIASFKFAPITSCDVERSFSMLKALYRDNRKSFTFDALQMHVVIHCNTN